MWITIWNPRGFVDAERWYPVRRVRKTDASHVFIDWVPRGPYSVQGPLVKVCAAGKVARAQHNKQVIAQDQ
jgi:hypothetical protein